MNRITNTDKWKDDWFLSLSIECKLLFMYLCDNCDRAGFYSLNSKFMSSQTGMTRENIVSSIQKLNKSLIFNKKRNKVWIRTFLFHQKQLPLTLTNPDHKEIKLILEKNLPDFNNNEDIIFILEKIENGKKTTSQRKTFKKPTEEEIKDYVSKYSYENNITIGNIDLWARNFRNSNQAKGWVVGKNKTPMKDWRAVVRTWLSNKEEKPEKGGRMDKLTKANEGTMD